MIMLKLSLLSGLVLVLCGCSPMVKPIEFKNFQRAPRPNDYLACPTNFCQQSADMTVPCYRLNLRRLQQAWQRVIDKEARMQLIQKVGQHYLYVQRSLIFRFPDFIDVEFIALSEKASTLAIYSRAYYGYSDFGVNRKRVQRLLTNLKHEIKQL